MSVFCFSSLKGGVGKTTLTVNVAHAFAQRGCKSLIIDFDPAGHASRLFLKERRSEQPGGAVDSFSPAIEPMARQLLSRDFDETRAESCVALAEVARECMLSLRPELDILPSGAELRHFLWGRGSRAFAAAFPKMVKHFRLSYDHILIDTPPDFNVLTRNAIASADMVVVPVDSSEMSINSLEELIRTAQHIRGPVWSIVRTMVSRGASRIQRMTNDSLKNRLQVDLASDENAPDFADTEFFMNVLRSRQAGGGLSPEEQNPIYLLRSMISRTEQHNRLSFLGKTAFDGGAAAGNLSKQYLAVARELEEIIAYLEEGEASVSSSEFLEELANGSSMRSTGYTPSTSDFELAAFEGVR